MTLSKKIEEILKDELKQESIKTVIAIVEYLRFKEKQSLWNKISESENEYVSEEESLLIKRIKNEDEFIDHDEVLKELGISKDEL